MADLDDVRRLALALPDARVDVTDEGQLTAGVAGKGFAWSWMERVEPRKPRVANPDVLAVRVAGATAKEELLAVDEGKFFTEPHYNGYPAVLVRLAAVDSEELRELLTDGWRVQAPRRLVRESGL